jgi:excisionase family DNA binding protein
MSAPQLIGKHAVAQRLDISPRTVLDLVARRELEGVLVGRLWKFDPSAIDAYIERRRRPAVVPEPTPQPSTERPPLPRVRRERFT